MAASIDELSTKLRDMVKCPVCLEQFKTPRSLPCQHSFCTQCLAGLLAGGLTIKCPCCKKETLVLNGVLEIPLDFRANSWMEILSEYERAKADKEAEVGGEAPPAAAEAVPQATFKGMSLDTKDPSAGNEPLYQSLYGLLGGLSPQPASPPQDARRGVEVHFRQAQPGATSEGLNLLRVLPMLELLTKAVSASERAETTLEESRLTFNPRCGKNAVVHLDQQTAHRQNPMDDYDNAVVLTARPLNPGELFEVRIDKMVDAWQASIQIGVTTHSLSESALPPCLKKIDSDAWFLTGKQVHNKSKIIKRYEPDILDKLKVGDRVGVQRKLDGDLHFHVNSVDLGVAASNIPADVYGVISVHGHTAQVTISSDISAAPTIQVGQKVRVKPGVKEPRHGWGEITHRSVGTIIAIDTENKKVKVDFPERLLPWTGCMSEMEAVPDTHSHTETKAAPAATAEPVEAKPYKKRTDFTSNDDYAQYVRDNIRVGRLVRCCSSYEQVKEGDIGNVVKLDSDGLHELNVHVEWQQKGGSYWVRYVHLELLGFPSPDDSRTPSAAAAADGTPVFQVGQKVRVKPSVVTPKYKWGDITHRSVGTIAAVDRKDQEVKVDFPESMFYWTGLMSEMELVPDTRTVVFGIGQKVRVRRGVERPQHGWGQISHRSVGTVAAMDTTHQKVVVAFPEQAAWTGNMSELENVEVTQQDPREVCRQM